VAAYLCITGRAECAGTGAQTESTVKSGQENFPFQPHNQAGEFGVIRALDEQGVGVTIQNLPGF